MIGRLSFAIVAAVGIATNAPAAPPPKDQGGASTVKNVDEPGRVPYRAYLEFNSAGCISADCANFNYLDFSNVAFDAPLVPAGKRLVIKWVSAFIVGLSGSTPSIILQASQSYPSLNARWQFSGPWFGYGMSSEAFVTYDSEERPHVRIGGPLAPNSVLNVTISGYLIDAN